MLRLQHMRSVTPGSLTMQLRETVFINYDRLSQTAFVGARASCVGEVAGPFDQRKNARS